MRVNKAVDYTKIIEKTAKKQREERKKGEHVIAMPEMNRDDDQVDYMAIASWWKEHGLRSVNEKKEEK